MHIFKKNEKKITSIKITMDDDIYNYSDIDDIDDVGDIDIGDDDIGSYGDISIDRVIDDISIDRVIDDISIDRVIDDSDNNIIDELSKKIVNLNIDKELKNNKKSKNDYSIKLKTYAEDGKIKDVTTCLKYGASPYKDKDYSLRLASMNGHTEIVKLLVKSHKDFKYTQSLVWSAKNGHKDIFFILIQEGAKISDLKNIMLMDYSTQNKRDIIIYLINNRVDIKTGYIFIYEYCSRNRYNNTECEKCLNAVSRKKIVVNDLKYKKLTKK